MAKIPQGIQCKISKRNKSAGRYGKYMARPYSAEKDGKIKACC